MNSRVIKLADPAAMAVDAAYRDLTVAASEVEAQLQTLAGNYGTLCEVTKAQGICCVSCENEQGTEVLLYPGLQLPGAEVAEAEVADKTVGDRFTTTLCGQTMTLQVKKILVNQPAALDDALGKACGFAGLQALTDSIRAELIEKKRTGNEKALTNAYMDYLVAASQCEIDEAEQEQWAMNNAQASMAETMAMGLDMGFPGEVPASEDELLRMMVEDFKQQFVNMLVVKAVCEQDGYEPDPATMMDIMIENERTMYVFDKLSRLAKEVLA